MKTVVFNGEWGRLSCCKPLAEPEVPSGMEQAGVTPIIDLGEVKIQ